MQHSILPTIGLTSQSQDSWGTGPPLYGMDVVITTQEITTCSRSLATATAPGYSVFNRFLVFERCSILRQNVDGLFHTSGGTPLPLVALPDIYVLLVAYFTPANPSILLLEHYITTYYFCTYNAHRHWDSLQVECQSPINNTLGVIECTVALGVILSTN